MITTEPAWLTAAADQRVAFMAETLGPGVAFLKGYNVVVTPLTEPDPGCQTQQWDKTCDNCGRYCPDGLVANSVQRDLNGVKIQVVFGACSRCMGGDAHGDAHR